MAEVEIPDAEAEAWTAAAESLGLTLEDWLAMLLRRGISTPELLAYLARKEMEALEGLRSDLDAGVT